MPADETFPPSVDAPTAPQDTLAPASDAPAPSSEVSSINDALSATDVARELAATNATHEMETPPSPSGALPTAERGDPAKVRHFDPTSATTLGGALSSVLLLGSLTAVALVMAKRPAPTQSAAQPNPAHSSTSPQRTPQSGVSQSAGQTAFNLPMLEMTPAPSLKLTPKTSLSGNPATGAPAVPPQSPAAPLFAQAIEFQKAGKPDEAAKTYRQVTKLQPKAAAAWINLAILLLQNKQPAQAIEPLQRATQLEPKNPALKQQLVRTLLALKRPKDALPPLRELATLQPKDVATQTMLAQLLQQGGKANEAYDQWVKLTNLDPQNPIPPFWAGLLAAQALRKPNAAEKYLRLAFDLQSRPGQKVTDARAPLFLAQVLLARGKAPQAAQVCEDGIKQFPQVVELHTQLADTRLAQKDLPGAIQATRDAIKIVPDQAPDELKARLHAGLGQMLLSNRQVKDGIVELRTASQLVPKNQKLAALLKAVETQSKNAPPQPALTAANAALLQKARDLGRASKWDAAAKAYATYNAAQENDAEGLAESAFVQEQRKDWKEADQLWAQVAVLQPKSSVPPLHRSEALRRLNRQPEALALLRRAYELAPDDPTILVALADAEAYAKNFDAARERMQKVLSLQPNFVPGYMALVDVAERGKVLPPAVEFLKKHIAKYPTHTEAFEALLAAYDDMGQTKQGRDFVKGWMARDKKNKAPRTALDNFDLFKAKQELQAGLQRDRERAKTQRPTATAAPIQTPEAAPSPKTDAAPEKPVDAPQPATGQDKQE